MPIGKSFIAIPRRIPTELRIARDHKIPFLAPQGLVFRANPLERPVYLNRSDNVLYSEFSAPTPAERRALLRKHPHALPIFWAINRSLPFHSAPIPSVFVVASHACFTPNYIISFNVHLYLSDYSYIAEILKKWVGSQESVLYSENNPVIACPTPNFYVLNTEFKRALLRKLTCSTPKCSVFYSESARALVRTTACSTRKRCVLYTDKERVLVRKITCFSPKFSDANTPAMPCLCGFRSSSLSLSKLLIAFKRFTSFSIVF